MTWNTLTTFVDGNVPTATQLNAFLQNIEHLHTPNYAYYEEPSTSGDFTTVSGTWANISANFSFSLTTSGGYVFCLLEALITNTELDISVNGTRLGNAGGDGSARWYISTGFSNSAMLPVLITDLAAGTHTIAAQFRRATASGTGTIFSAYCPRFLVYEL